VERCQSGLIAGSNNTRTGGGHKVEATKPVNASSAAGS
jgi:hypothetical protein